VHKRKIPPLKTF